MVYRVPDSTPPSTPDSRRASRNNPSTTPAGPPPSSIIPSSTPAGPPPSSYFGSSHLNTSYGASYKKSAFQSSHINSSPPKPLLPLGSNRFTAPASTRSDPYSRASVPRGRTGYHAPASSPPQVLASDEEEQYSDEEEGSEYDEEDEDRMDEDEDYEDQDQTGQQSHFSASAASRGYSLRDPEIFDSPRGIKRSRQGASVQPTTASENPHSALAQSKYNLLKLAKGLASPPEHVKLHEPDGLILETEQLMGKLNESVTSDNPLRKSEVLAEVAQQLVSLWRSSSRTQFNSSIRAVGPPAGESPVTKANFLASLLLQLYYPSQASRYGRPSAFSTFSNRPYDAKQITPIPKILLDWMNTYHTSSSEIGAVLKEQRGYSAHPEFWDAVKYSAFRGNFSMTLKLLKGANFEVAESAAVDGLGDYGYEGMHLANINTAVQSAITLIQSCPAVQSGDWDVKGNDWSLFRRQVSETISDLKDFAEGSNYDQASIVQPFQAENFGISTAKNNLKLSMASRRAESKVAWSIYQNLVILYKQLQGEEEEILGNALDWVEAVIGLAVWWDGETEEIPKGTLAMSRRSISRSQRARPVDLTPTSAYRQKLSSAFATVVDGEEQDFSINPTSAFEIGLACIFEDNIEGIIQILQGWSIVIASAVVEVASAGNWLEETRKSKDIMKGFDKSDLMVLSYGQQERAGFDKDELMIHYAHLLSRKEIVQSHELRIAREGWELAVQVLGRLDDEDNANSLIGNLLNGLGLTSVERVDKILALCNNLGFTGHASTIAAKYADHLSETTTNYGDALVYYARAHQPKKIREVLDILVSLCLVQSLSYPPVSELDDRLRLLITSPKQTLTQLSRTDLEAAQLLSTYLSGYATIRKFYDLRDEEVNTKSGQKPSLRPMARKRAAASALMVIISSAASSIRGGLYDPSIETVVQVDGLLALLGEALVFVNQPKRVLTLSHLYTLLAAIEDLQTSPSLIYAQCEECFASTLAAAHGADAPSPRTMLKKSISNLTTASSQFSLVGSSMLGSGSGGEGQSTESSAVLIKSGNVGDVKRAWDWRKGFAKDVSGLDVLRVLRLGIAEEIGRAWVEGE
ncbi:hypothetical protein AOQ84DRAFT_354868 [Glonium stellatum]|uniref:Nuclear pore complex protein Nup85 n=1 Tax=Glonium stellatum TaxID=574774 RepID=A0A8E2JSL6_9PEZI|nr:hypothetical protein AOQ84DRAFT_354868 [Glonium stellatum]